MIKIMEAYYHNQATMPHFSGHHRQRGSGFGLLQAAPELIDIATRKKTPKQALKNTVKNTIKKQVRAGRSKSRMSRKRKTATTTTRKIKTKVLIPKKQTPLRSRSNFFTKVRNDF